MSHRVLHEWFCRLLDSRHDVVASGWSTINCFQTGEGGLACTDVEASGHRDDELRQERWSKAERSQEEVMCVEKCAFMVNFTF